MDNAIEERLAAAGLSLPPGRLVAPKDGGPPAYWLSDAPASAGLWATLRAAHPQNGLWPVLLAGMDREPNRPWVDGEVGLTVMSPPDEHDPDQALATLWRSVTGSAEPDPAQRPEVMGWAEWGDVGTPYDRPWPGLAPGRPAPDAGDAAGESVAAQILDLAHREHRLGLIAADRGADAIAVVGWGGPMNLTNDVGPLAAVLRSWEDRFAIQVVAIGFDTLTLSVGAPPVELDHAIHVAAEHFAFCPDNVWQSSTDSLTSYGEHLSGASTWSFWWD